MALPKGTSGNPKGPPAYNPVDARAEKLAKAQTQREQIEAVTDTPKRAWSSAKCKVCRSSHRADIDRMRAKGIPARQIERELYSRYGEKISYAAIIRHEKNHVDVAEVVAGRLVEEGQDVRESLDSDTSNLQRLQAYIERATRIEKVLSDYVMDSAADGHAPPMSIAHSYETVTNGLRMAIKLHEDLIGGQPADDVDELLAALWSTEDAPVPPKHEPNERIRSDFNKSDGPGAEKTG